MVRTLKIAITIRAKGVRVQGNWKYWKVRCEVVPVFSSSAIQTRFCPFSAPSSSGDGDGLMIWLPARGAAGLEISIDASRLSEVASHRRRRQFLRRPTSKKVGVTATARRHP